MLLMLIKSFNILVPMLIITLLFPFSMSFVEQPKLVINNIEVLTLEACCFAG